MAGPDAIAIAWRQPPKGGKQWLVMIDRGVGTFLEYVAAGLVLAEVAILFSGIVARYVLRTPLIWSDELASILFLWLAMIGAAIAIRLNEHMRMTACVARLDGAYRDAFELVATAASLAFLALTIAPACEYAISESFITTPALGIPNSWRVAALPVGILFMLYLGLVRLFKQSSLVSIAIVLVVSVAILLAANAIGTNMRSLGQWNLLIFFVGVVAVTIFAGVPIAFSFGLATFGYLALATHLPTIVMIGRIDEGMSHIILLAVPLFIFLGVLMEMTGMAHALVRFLVSILGHVRGGLTYTLIGAMYLVSGISGSKAADMAAVAPVLFPEMKARGAKPGDLVALLSATGAQTETIPPSLVLITVGSVTGVSIAALFTGGLLPGVILGATLSVVVWFRYRKEDLIGVKRASGREVFKSLMIALPALFLPFVIRAAVLEGIATATEVSTIGIIYSIFVGLFVYRQFPWRRLKPMLVQTAELSGAILIIIGVATSMAWALTQSGFSTKLAEIMSSLPGGSHSFIAVSLVAFIILGSVLEGIPAIVLLGPLLFPVANQLGIHEVHYAMVVILAMGIGLFAPPFGVGYYVACAIGRVDPTEGIGPIWGYMLALLGGLVLIAAFPWLSIGFL
jgi:tripartite ATP-independent transporter DctM subunit